MGALLGRGHEMRVLDDALERLGERGAALVIYGEAGIGKSSLLAYARGGARTRGMVTLAAVGVQSETRLPFAGLHQLLQPILDDIEELPDPQRDALRTAFGLASATRAPDLFLIALAVLNLLSGAAERAPLLVIADDAQWLDLSTCDVLAFLARRLASEPILLLCALRDGFTSVLMEANLPEMRLAGLDAAAAAALLDAQADPLDATIRTRLLENAAGNPLALIELSSALRVEAWGSDALLPPWLPLTTRLERAFSARAAELPGATGAILLAAAVDDSSILADALNAGSALWDGAPISAEAIEPAIQAGLVELDDIHLRFRHPLMRSALYQAAGAARQRAAHAALAAVLAGQPDRAIWHRAAALVGPDEQVAADLAATADRALLRGANAVAVTTLTRAAQLSATPTRQGAWLLQAATLAYELDIDLARKLLGVAESLDLSPQHHVEALWLHEVIFEEGRQWTGAAWARPFVEMAERARLEGNADLALDYLWRIALRCFWSNPDQETRELIAMAAECLPLPETHPKLISTLAFVAPIECGAVVLERLPRLPRDDNDPASAYLWGIAATAVGAFSRAADLLSPAIATLRMQGRVGLVAQGLVSQALATRYTGNWQVAAPAAEEAVRLTRETGQPLWAAAAQAVGAAIDGLRGETDRAEASASEAEQTLRTVAANPMLALVQLARGAAALTAGRHAEAFEQLWRMFDPLDSAYHPIVRCWAVGDLVEAAVHSGLHDQARAVTQEFEALAKRSPFPALLAGLSYARPLLANDDQAETLFLAGLADPDDNLANLALTRERLQLAYGAWLRRHRRPMESRAPLRAARDAFDAFGAAPWAERARQELRASGETSHHHEPVATDRLTPQELQIALLAANGLSNREIGQRLYLSHRTVGFHLYHIFPKLGVSSRAELNAVLVATRASE